MQTNTPKSRKTAASIDTPATAEPSASPVLDALQIEKDQLLEVVAREPELAELERQIEPLRERMDAYRDNLNKNGVRDQIWQELNALSQRHGELKNDIGSAKARLRDVLPLTTATTDRKATEAEIKAARAKISRSMERVTNIESSIATVELEIQAQEAATAEHMRAYTEARLTGTAPQVSLEEIQRGRELADLKSSSIESMVALITAERTKIEGAKKELGSLEGLWRHYLRLERELAFLELQYRIGPELAAFAATQSYAYLDQEIKLNTDSELVSKARRDIDAELLAI